MAPRGDPAPLRWLIGVELARYRNTAKLSLTKASDLSGISRADPELRQAQLRHLLAMAERSMVTIQVIRPEDGPHTALTGQFVVLGFDNVRSIGYVELYDGALYLPEPCQVATYTIVAQDLQRVALGPERSISFIQSMITS